MNKLTEAFKPGSTIDNPEIMMSLEIKLDELIKDLVRIQPKLGELLEEAERDHKEEIRKYMNDIAAVLEDISTSRENGPQLQKRIAILADKLKRGETDYHELSAV